MPDTLMLVSTACALVAGALAGWYAAQRHGIGQRERWERALHLAVDEARTDPLTKLGNRRAFDEQLAIQVAVAERYGAPCAVVLIDIDDLKAVNDRAGHSAGDAALRQLADLLKRSSRASDLAMRIGGDEFALVLPQTDLAGALTMAARISERVAAPHGQTTTDTVAPLVLRASLGVAAYRPDETGAALINRADQALYHAKQTGGHRVCAHDGDAVTLHRSIDKSIL